MKAQPSASGHKTGPAPNDYRPVRVRELLRSSKLALDQFHHRNIGFDELGRYAGQVGTTIFEKLQKDLHPQIETLLGWLERLPEGKRLQLINGACRTFPYLEHPRLGHDPVQVSSLRSLLQQPAGLTLVVGPNEGLRTWLISAIGHGSLMQGPEHRRVCGIDRHLPDWFVPVDGVTYLNSPLTETPSADSIQKAWAKCAKGEENVLLLNGIVSLKPELRPEVLALATRRNVFVADGDPLLGDWFAERLPPAGRLRILRVSLTEAERILVKFETFATSLRS